MWGTKLAVMPTNLIQQFNKCQQKFSIFLAFDGKHDCYLTVIPRARMGSESIAHEAEGAEWAYDSEAMRPSSWSKISRQNNFS